MTTLHLIDWFWAEHAQGKVSFDKDGFCQCESESLINKSSDPYLMRAFLVVGVFIDQLVHSHHKKFYGSFSQDFRYPKNHGCQTRGMICANWFVYSYHGYDKKISRDRLREVAEIIIPETIQWLTQHDETFDNVKWAIDDLYPEIHHVFEARNAGLLHDIMNNIVPYEGTTPHKRWFNNEQYNNYQSILEREAQKATVHRKNKQVIAEERQARKKLRDKKYLQTERSDTD